MKFRSSLHWLWLSALILVLDQVTKWLALEHLVYAHPEPVLPFLNWTLLFNRGMAFSLLNEGGWQANLLAVLSTIVSLILIVWLWRSPARERLQCASLALVIGGAVGNLVGRVRFGYVVDFIDVYYGSWHWPAFNIADSAITVGAILLIVSLIRQERRHAD